MSEAPVPQDPGQDEDPPGTPVGPGDYPRFGVLDWRLVPSGPEWPEWPEWLEWLEWMEWMDEPGYLAARCEDDPGRQYLTEPTRYPI
jgi:hypothetical protein